MTTSTDLLILLVDDDADQREYLSNKFLHHGCRILQAEDAGSALRLLEQYKVDIVVSDFLMPGGKETGVDLVKTVSQKAGHKPVMVLTTGFVEFLPDQAFNLDEIAVIFTKPFDAEKLVSVAFERCGQRSSA